MKKLIVAVAAMACTVGGCASDSSSLHAEYTSPMLYQNYSCSQLAMEDTRLRGSVAELKGDVNRDATNDKIMVGVGVALFWPALFFIKGNGEAEAQYQSLKGQHDAIQQAYTMKNCANGGSSGQAAASTQEELTMPMPESRTRY